VALYIVGQVIPNLDVISILLNWRIGFDPLHRAFVAGEPVVALVNRSVYHHLVGTAGPDGDVSRAGREIKVYGTGDTKRTVEMPVAERV
jgi:hypothetical protein